MRLRAEREKREACEYEHRNHATLVGIHAALVDHVSRNLAKVDRDERDDCVKSEDERHAHSRIALVPELVGEVTGSPEEEEPPNAISEEAAKDERPSLAKRKRLGVGNLLFLLLRLSGDWLRTFVLVDVL